MSYYNQIKILEQKLTQLGSVPKDADHTYKVIQIESQIRKLKRLEWEENHERIKMDEER
jgi:hypothetical protein